MHYSVTHHDHAPIRSIAVHSAGWTVLDRRTHVGEPQVEAPQTWATRDPHGVDDFYWSILQPENNAHEQSYEQKPELEVMRQFFSINR